MKPIRHFSHILQWIVVAIVVVVVIATGILTNITLRSIENNLPVLLLTELEALERLTDTLSEAVSAAISTQRTPSSENHIRLRHKVRIVFDEVVKLRETYVFDNLIRASAFHAVVAPAFSDIQLWLVEGVSGFGPETGTTLDIVISRITDAFSKARVLNHDSREIARNILIEQRFRLERFLFSVNLLIVLTLAITGCMIYLMTRRQVFLRKELETQRELRRAEKSLKETEELYSKLIAAIPDVVVRSDVNGKILFVNDVEPGISGYDREDLLGKNILEFIAPEDREYALENMRLMNDRRLGPKEYRLVMKNGEKVPFEINSDVLRRRDGTAYGAVNICRNISKRLKAEEALREREKQYRQLVENANDAIFIAQDGKIKFPNPRTLEILGYTNEQPEEIVFPDYIHPDDREMVVDLHRRRLTGEENLPTNYTFRVINSTGRVYNVQLNAVKIVWEGRPATLNFVRDITNQMNLEASLQQARKMEAIGTLAGGIAHDFNNLLMGIQGRISLMMFEIETGHPFFENLSRIEDCVKSATDLTRQLLGFARGGKYEIKPSCMNEVLEQSIELFGRTRKEIQVHKNYQAHLWTVEVDPGQMNQVLLNLLINAWHAMPSGGNLHLRTENCVIHHDSCWPTELRPGNYVKISVTDTGVGMDETTKARIFEPFFTTKEMGRGTGLGLASSYGIVRNHGGCICVESSIGQGSTFSFYLPALKNALTPHPPGPEESVKNNIAILLVDDEEIVIEIAKQFLEILGYSVFTARSGQEAMETCSRECGNIELVILDMNIAKIDVGQTVRHLRTIHPKIRIVLSSGYSCNTKASEIMNLGCHGFIQKPYGLSELSDTIHNAFQSSEADESNLLIDGIRG